MKIKGGQCISDGATDRCVCKQDYIGHLCDVKNLINATVKNHLSKHNFSSCNEARCANGGACKQVGPNEAECVCPKNFAGKYCQKKELVQQLKSYNTYGEECSNTESSSCDFTKGLICNNEKSNCNCPLKLDKNKCDCPIDKFWNGFSCGVYNFFT